VKEPVWIPREVVLSVHEELLARFGGLAGIRDEARLQAALDRPRNTFAYEGPKLFPVATAYTSGIVKNHPFLDGNKRTGFMLAYLFLQANGYSFRAPEEEVVERTLALAAGAIKEADYAEWLERSSELAEKSGEL